MPYTAALSAAASIGLVLAKHTRQPSFAYVRPVTILSLGALLAILIAFAWLRSAGDRLPGWLDRDGAASWLFGLQLGVLLLPVPVLALVKNIAADDQAWTWPFLNKRWLVALYLLGVAAITLFPLAFDTWQVRVRTPQTPPDAPRLAGGSQTRSGSIAIVAALLIAWFFAGPPWHTGRVDRPLEYHEQVHLGSLQAIAKGYEPYVGPASTQYGPGSQLLIYGFMRLAGGFDVPSFRAAWAAMNVLTLSVVAVVAAWWFAPGPALAIVLVAVVYSPMAFYGTIPNGALDGFFGWANGLRYLAPLLIVPALVTTVGSRRVLLLGGLWAAGSWVAQESLASTALSAGLLLALLWLTRTTSAAVILRTVRDLLGGFAIVAVAILLYYAQRGAVAEVIRNYLSVPRAVSAGFQNMWWLAGSSAVRTFYALPFFIAGVMVCALWRLPALVPREPLDRDDALAVAFVSVQLACYPVALLRSDAAHLQNTTIALPFIVVLGTRLIPSWLAVDSRRRVLVRMAFVAVALAILPAGRLLRAREIFVTPYKRFVKQAPSLGITDAAVADSEWMAFAAELHGLVGQRRTFVASTPVMTAGTLYFLADLVPAPLPLDGDTMILNSRDASRVVDDLRAHPGRYEAFVSTSLTTPEATAFIAGHPDARRIERTVAGRPVFILLTP